MERSIFYWGELGSRFRGPKPNKTQKLIQATPWEELADNEEIDHICCSPQLTVFVLKDGRVYTLSNGHKRGGRLELITALQDEKIHTVDSGGSNILYVSEAGNVYFSKVANKSCIVTEPKLLSSFAGRYVIQVACGSNHSLALCKDGQVFVWGKNAHGQLGVGNAVGCTHSPQPVEALAGIPLAQIAAGRSHTIAVSLSGTVFGWGANHYGQLGLDDVKARYHPTCVKLLECKKVVRVFCGAHHTAALNKDGLVYTFGAGRCGQLGHNSDRDEWKPRLLEGLSGIKVSQIACGSYHTMVFSSTSGQLYSFGRGENGQLGTGQTIAHFVPCLVTFPTDRAHNRQPAPDGLLQPAVKRIFAGANQSIALCFGVKASHSAEYQSSFSPLRRIIMAEDSFWNTWNILDNGELQNDIKEEIGHIFSAECLNGSFLEVSGDEHFKIGRGTSGLDLSAASLWFEKLGKHPILLQEVTTTVEENLIPSLTKSPAGVEALRVYLVLPELIDVQMEEKNSVKLTVLLSTAMAALEESQLQILESWWSNLNEFCFNKLVNWYISASHFLLQGISSTQMTIADELRSCLSILQRLFKVNSTRKPKYQENKFYNCAQEVFGDKPVSCKALLDLIPYPCIFNMENKIRIFRKICQLNISNDNITDYSIIFGNINSTKASAGIINVSASLEMDACIENIVASAGDTDTSNGIIEASAGDTDTSTGIIEASAGDTDTFTEIIEVSNENTEISTVDIEASTGNPDTSTRITDGSTETLRVISHDRIEWRCWLEGLNGLLLHLLSIVYCLLTGNTETCARMNDVPNGNSETSTGNTEISTGIIEISTGISDSLTEIIEASAGDNRSIETSTGNIEATAGSTETSTGNTEASTRSTETSTGMIEISTQNPETSTEIMATSASTVETSTGNINDSNGIVPAPELTLELSGEIDENSTVVDFEFDWNSEEDDFEDGYDYFDDEDEIIPSDERTFLHVNRTEILQTTLPQLRSKNTTALRGYFQVEFMGEAGIDEGGVSQEFFSVIAEEFCRRPRILKHYEESRLVWFPEWEPEVKDVYRLLGIICWLALYNGYVADFHFPLALYKKLLNEQPTLDDLKELSPTIGRNLQELLNYEGDDLEEIFSMDFTIGADMADGSITGHELIPNGKNIPVQSHNRKLFVDKYVDYVFNKSVKKHFQAFSEGFRYVPLPVIDLFFPDELMALLQGNTMYDWPKLEESARYEVGYTGKDEAIVQFWQMFHELTQEEKKHFLTFLTGCDKVPIGGMGTLRITIQVDFRTDPDLYFPTAHTCSRTLDLPRYSSPDILRERFLRAIGCSRVFGIA